MRRNAISDSIGENGAFAIGEFDLFMTHLIRNRIEVLFELVIESDIEGVSFIDLKRVQVGYVFSDALKLYAGRFHNILGYWNTTFHHWVCLVGETQGEEGIKTLLTIELN